MSVFDGIIEKADTVPDAPSNSPDLFGAASIGLQAGVGISSIVGGFLQAGVQKEQAKILTQRAQFNAEIATLRAADAVRLGKDRVQQYFKSVNKLKGKQTVSYAAGNVKVGTGVARTLKDKTTDDAMVSAVNIMTNAQNQAWGLEGVAMAQTNQASAIESTTNIAASNTILSGFDNATRRGFGALETARQI